MDAPARQRLFERGVERIFDPALLADMQEIVEDVREHGDDALVRALARFDGCEVERDELLVGAEETEEGREQVSPELAAALRTGIANIRSFNQEVATPRSWRTEIAPGLEVGEQATPIASAGLFVPCGKGSYPSVLMQIGVPAVVAGVPELTVAVPPVPGGSAVDPAVLWLAAELGIDRVLRSNGPAGVAALALGTETVPRARKVLGPGSPAVQAAQVICQLYGCQTQMILGPTESAVIADASADPRLLAADLLNEAEHGPDSISLLITPEEGLVEATQGEIAEQLAQLPEPRRGWATTALGETGGAILTEDLAEAAEVADFFAPEHLQLAVADPEGLVTTVKHAGEVLLGQDTLFSMANYVLGVPASLPTGGFALVTGGVTAATFLKRTSVAAADATARTALAPASLALAEHEGFPAHAAAVRARPAAVRRAQGTEGRRRV